MARESNKMVSFRLPAAALTRLDYVVRNTDTEGVKNRSTALLIALMDWLPGQEDNLVRLGVLEKKTR